MLKTFFPLRIREMVATVHNDIYQLIVSRKVNNTVFTTHFKCCTFATYNHKAVRVEALVPGLLAVPKWTPRTAENPWVSFHDVEKASASPIQQPPLRHNKQDFADPAPESAAKRSLCEDFKVTEDDTAVAKKKKKKNRRTPAAEVTQSMQAVIDAEVKKVKCHWVVCYGFLKPTS